VHLPGKEQTPLFCGCARPGSTHVLHVSYEDMLDLEIAALELSNQLQSGAKLVLLDVREPWEVATARIEGAKNIPMGEIASRVFQELDPQKHIVVYCHSGIRSMNATVWLRSQGFDKAQSLRGGVDAWSREIDPKVPRY
jgi:rhodanese-related sulfurtransferase